MKNKIIILGIVLLIAGILTSYRLEPERRVYPLAMGFDLSDQGYEVYYDIPDLSTCTGEGKPMDTGERVWHFTGINNQDIEGQMLRSKKETPDMGHVQVIILGRRLIETPDKYGKVLESFVNKPVMGSSAYVFICEDLASVMEAGAQKTDSLGKYLVNLVDKIPQKNQAVLQDLYNAYYNQEERPSIGAVAVVDSEIVCEVG